jgi:hypothetical protein
MATREMIHIHMDKNDNRNDKLWIALMITARVMILIATPLAVFGAPGRSTACSHLTSCAVMAPKALRWH